MQTQASSNLNFTGKKEVIYNLAKALDNAKFHAPVEMSSKSPSQLDYHYLGRVEGYLDAAVNDDEFFKVVQDASTSLNTPTSATVSTGKRLADGSSKWNDYTLAQIANQTGGQGNGTVNKATGFKIFADKLHSLVRKRIPSDDANMKSVKTFVDELKSKITRGSQDDYDFENTTEKFNEIMAKPTSFDYNF